MGHSLCPAILCWFCPDPPRPGPRKDSGTAERVWAVLSPQMVVSGVDELWCTWSIPLMLGQGTSSISWDRKAAFAAHYGGSRAMCAGAQNPSTRCCWGTRCAGGGLPLCVSPGCHGWLSCAPSPVRMLWGIEGISGAFRNPKPFALEGAAWVELPIPSHPFCSLGSQPEIYSLAPKGSTS